MVKGVKNLARQHHSSALAQLTLRAAGVFKFGAEADRVVQLSIGS